MNDDGGPAFPMPVAVGPAGDVYCGADVSGGLGMSLRDWFAGQAIIGLIAEREQLKASGRMYPMATTMAEDAWLIANAMLKARAGTDMTAAQNEDAA